MCLLLGICFLVGVPVDVVGEIGEGERGGDKCIMEFMYNEMYSL
jgi:hypothetical protein